MKFIAPLLLVAHLFAGVTSFAQGEQMTLYSKLVNPAPQARSEARQQLAAVATRQVADDVRRLMVASSNPEVAEAGLLFLHERDATELPKLLPLATNVPSSRVRSALLALLDEPLAGKSVRLVAPFLHDTNIIVRVRAAHLLRKQGNLSQVVAVAVDALGSDETETFGDPPVPAFALGKRLLVDINDKEKVLAELEKHAPKSERVRYHLLDVKAVLSGKCPSFIYYSVGEPPLAVKAKFDNP